MASLQTTGAHCQASIALRLPRRFTDWSARFAFLAGGLIALHWLFSLWLGFQQWQIQFREAMSVSLLLRYLVSPVLPLQLAAAGLLFLACIRTSRYVRRVVVGGAGLAAFFALGTPGGFAHDLGHCVIHECSSRLWVLHLVRCLGIAGTAWLGLAVAEANAFGKGNRQTRNSTVDGSLCNRRWPTDHAG